MNKMNDLEIARNRLENKDFSLVIVKKGNLIFETKERKIAGFIDAIEKLGASIIGSFVADKVVGKAIAQLCIYAKVSGVYARVLSKEAKRLFENLKINFEYLVLVNEILNHEQNQICPFELKANSMNDPKKTYCELKKLANLFRS
jgi:hypothetical protein